MYELFYVFVSPAVFCLLASCRVLRSSGIYHSTCIPDGQSDAYRMMYWYNWFSWWWALCCSKHV